MLAMGGAECAERTLMDTVLVWKPLAGHRVQREHSWRWCKYGSHGRGRGCRENIDEGSTSMEAMGWAEGVEPTFMEAVLIWKPWEGQRVEKKH